MSCPSFHLSPSRPRWFWWMESNADQQRGILLRMRQENLFGAFGAILIFSARFCGFSTERSTPFCDIFWRGMEEYDKFTTISNSVDTCGVCWLFGWGYFNDQSANKTRKKSKTWSLRFDLLTIKMCTWDYKPWRLVLRCWCLTSINHEVMCGGDREIFVTIIEGSLQFDLILLQIWNKITLSSRWPPSFKSLQIISYLLSLCCPIGHKA